MRIIALRIIHLIISLKVMRKINKIFWNPMRKMLKCHDKFLLQMQEHFCCKIRVYLQQYPLQIPQIRYLDWLQNPVILALQHFPFLDLVLYLHKIATHKFSMNERKNFTHRIEEKIVLECKISHSCQRGNFMISEDAVALVSES